MWKDVYRNSTFFCPKNQFGGMNLGLPYKYITLMDVSLELTDAHFIYMGGYLFANINGHFQYAYLENLAKPALLQ